MDNERLEFTLPPAPRGLCFDRNDFVKTHFSVDIFLAEHQNVVSLENMRDDLGVYLKVLRLAMIELINRDYANFVNLSATLIGFNKAIEKIQVPLVNLNQEVLGVKQCLEEAMKELSMWLNQRNGLRNKKHLLKHYSQTVNALNTLNSILKNISESSIQDRVALADRGVQQYNQLKFSITKSDILIKAEQKAQYQTIGVRLTQILNDLLFVYLNKKDEINLLKVLIALASLDKVEGTESLIRKDVIAPLLLDVISESSLQRNNEGLHGIYKSVLSVLDNDLKLLLMIMHHPKLLSLTKRYNFLVNCFWCEVESRLELNLSSIFAPGNPKIFYSRYNDSMGFISKLEGYCDKEMFLLLKNTNEYKSFVKRWNLPVYFQIRFQEIAGSFETHLQNGPTLENNGEFLLKETHHCWKCLQECWSDGIYIEALAYKFWKLSLQLLSRYTVWVHSSMQASTTISDSSNLINTSIDLHLDTQKLLQKLPEFLQSVERRVNIKNKVLFRESLLPTEERLKDTRRIVKKYVVNELSNNCNSLKQVSDIPRLYRKTNRSVPNKPCMYIDQVSKTIQEFHSEAKKKLDNPFLLELYEELFNALTSLYYKSVEDVLTSVQKTEESLRRLKQIRVTTPQQASEATGTTDGDKIRLQVYVDVTAYIKIVMTQNINVNNIEKLNELANMVRDAVKNIDIK